MGRRRAASAELIELHEAVTKWRTEGGGGRGSKLPEALWDEAVRVARVDGLWRTATTLGLKYEKLKQRVAQGDGREVVTTTDAIVAKQSSGWRGGTLRRKQPKAKAVATRRRKSGAFIELEAGQLFDTSSSMMSTVIEVADKSGTRMTVRLGKEAKIDVARWLGVFRRRRA